MDEFKIGYILKKANSDKYNCWLTYDYRMNTFILRHKERCILFDDLLFQTENRLRALVEDNILEEIQVKYKLDKSLKITQIEEEICSFKGWRFWSATYLESDYNIILNDY